VALFALAGLGGTAVGLVRGGRLHRLLGLRLRAGPLAIGCLGAQVALGAGGRTPPTLLRDAVVVGSYAGIGLFLLLNARAQRNGLRAAFLVLAAGWVLNVVPMALNDGMPVSLAAMRAAGVSGEDVDEGNLWKHVPATASTDVAWLGDVIPVPPLRAVISVGDVVLLAGVGAVVALGLSAGGPRLPARTDG
jgi:hypothetical protein